jgi:hypothetical protein
VPVATKILDNSVLVGEGSRLQDRVQELAPHGVIVNSHSDSVPDILGENQDWAVSNRT